MQLAQGWAMRVLAVVVALIAAGLGGAGAAAQTPFGGRAVTLLVGNPPGGGYDRFAQAW